MCQSLFLNKVAGLKPETLAQVFSYKFFDLEEHLF